jgi:uncharacterized membrane protein YuzA (DUF378 family)
MWLIDFLTLVLILAAGFQLGIQGVFDFDVTGWLLGTDAAIAYDVIGAAAIWQLLRQKFQ